MKIILTATIFMVVIDIAQISAVARRTNILLLLADDLGAAYT